MRQVGATMCTAGGLAWTRRLALGAGLLVATCTHAHDFRIGAIVIDHPYAVPSAPGASEGNVYLRWLKNTGQQPDRLLGARSSASRRVEIRRTEPGAAAAQGQALDSIELPAGANLPMRHDGTLHLVLVGLATPLAPGDRLTLLLRFQHAGEKTVDVVVQEPRRGATVHRP